MTIYHHFFTLFLVLFSVNFVTPALSRGVLSRSASSFSRNIDRARNNFLSSKFRKMTGRQGGDGETHRRALGNKLRNPPAPPKPRVWRQAGGDMHNSGRSIYNASVNLQLMWQTTLDDAVSSPALVTVTMMYEDGTTDPLLGVITKDSSLSYHDMLNGRALDSPYSFASKSQDNILSWPLPPIEFSTDIDVSEESTSIYFNFQANSEGIVRVYEAEFMLLYFTSTNTADTFRSPPSTDGTYLYYSSDQGNILIYNQAALIQQIVKVSPNSRLTTPAIKITFLEDSIYFINATSAKQLEDFPWVEEAELYRIYVSDADGSVFAYGWNRTGEKEEYYALNGDDDGVPVFDASTAKVKFLWKYDACGVTSTPVYEEVNDQIIITTTCKDGSYIIALDAESGEKNWNKILSWAEFGTAV
jgi:hypothetical protein